MSSVCLHTRTQTNSRLSNCSTDDLVVISRPLLHESLNEVMDVTDSREVDALLCAPYCIVHRVEIRAVWRPLQRSYEIWSISTQHLDSLTGTVSRHC